MLGHNTRTLTRTSTSKSPAEPRHRSDPLDPAPPEPGRSAPGTAGPSGAGGGERSPGAAQRRPGPSGRATAAGPAPSPDRRQRAEAPPPPSPAPLAPGIHPLLPSCRPPPPSLPRAAAAAPAGYSQDGGLGRHGGDALQHQMHAAHRGAEAEAAAGAPHAPALRRRLRGGGGEEPLAAEQQQQQQAEPGGGRRFAPGHAAWRRARRRKRRRGAPADPRRARSAPGCRSGRRRGDPGPRAGWRRGRRWARPGRRSDGWAAAPRGSAPPSARSGTEPRWGRGPPATRAAAPPCAEETAWRHPLSGTVACTSGEERRKAKWGD